MYFAAMDRVVEISAIVVVEYGPDLIALFERVTWFASSFAEMFHFRASYSLPHEFCGIAGNGRSLDQ